MLTAHRDSLLPAPGQVQPAVAIERGSEFPVPFDLADLADLADNSGVGGGAGPEMPPDAGSRSNESPEPNESPAPIDGAASPAQPPVVPGSTLTTPDVAPGFTPSPVPTVAPEATPPFPMDPTPLPPRAFRPGPVVPTAIATPQAIGQVVDLVLVANVAAVSVGDLVSVAVTVNAGSGNAVDAAQVYLDFDASVLQVVKLTGSLALTEELQSNYDNILGQIDYAAGTLGAPITSSFQLLVVQFQAVAQTGPSVTTIRFASLVIPRQTKAVTAGINITGNLSAVNLIIR